MRRKLVHFLLLSALVAVSTLALADPPALVGRISSAEGQVTVESDGEEASGGLLNWPLTSDSRITTASGARMEFRVGSTAVRLDGDSSLEVSELDDDRLSLRLNYGSASVRIRNVEALSGFELTTPQTRVAMTEPGLLRVDSERAPDTSVVAVLAGAAQVEAAGTALTVRAGRRAEVRGEDVVTGAAQRDRFDDWAQSRDQRDENVTALRYVPQEVTGYEELDQYGTWRDSEEYGPLWTPRSLPLDWAPYRDGRWTWLQPWGWTWVDNAPWGYAPSHYGRWVVVSQRWHWAPGRHVGRPAWSPALVGWVGGNQWNVAFGNRHSAPGVGWFPLSPRDRYVPPYRVSPEHERRLGWHGGKWNGRDNGQGRDRGGRDDRNRDGFTVLPRDRFDTRQTFHVNRSSRAIVTPGEVKNQPLTAAPQPASPGRPGRVTDTRRFSGTERGDERGNERGSDRGSDRGSERDNERGNERDGWRGRGLRTGERSNVISTQPPGAQPLPSSIAQRQDRPQERPNWRVERPARSGNDDGVRNDRGDHGGRRPDNAPNEARWNHQRPAVQGPSAQGPIVQQPSRPFAPPPVRVAPQPVTVAPQPVQVAPPQAQPQAQPQPNSNAAPPRRMREQNRSGHPEN